VTKHLPGIRPVAVAIGWFALSGIAQAQSLETLHQSGAVESGVETVLAHGRHWNTAPCIPLRTTVAIVKPPAPVRIVDEIAAVPKTTLRGGSTGYCAGMLLYGKKILYQSEPGFEGPDTLSYESIGPNGLHAPYTVTIMVKAGD
jgi:hypothetical protein